MSYIVNLYSLTVHTSSYVSTLHCDWLSYSQVVTCATDSLLMLWDVATGERVRKYRGHQTFVNSVDLARRGPQMMCSGSDDGTIKVGGLNRISVVENYILELLKILIFIIFHSTA